MKLNLKTIKLNTILASIEKGVGAIRVLPVTEFIKIALKKGTLTVSATDSINFIEYTEKGFEGEDGEALVKANQLIKLAERTTKEEIQLELKETHLEVKGNGTYKVELNTEDEFPTYAFKKAGKGTSVSVKELVGMFNTNSAAVATEMIMPCLTGYSIGEVCTTTDGVKMSINKQKILSSNILVTQQQAELLKTLTTEKVTVHVDGNKLLFETPNIKIFGVELDDKEDYPDITELSELEMVNKVAVSKTDLVNALNRLMLFVDSFDNGGVTLVFNKGKLKLKDMKENSEEEINYVSKEIKDKAEVSVSIFYLLDLVNVLSTDTIELLYNADGESPIMIKHDKVTQLLSIMEKEEAS